MDENAFRVWISGDKRGVLPALFRFVLSCPSVCYGLGVSVRNRAFEDGWKRIHRAPVPVLSVGNITTGGTGKTPFVAYLARWFRDKGVRVAFLSRGYRALPGEVNDEKLVLDQLCPDVLHLQNPDRVVSAGIACKRYGSHLLILDDGFQHRRLARTLDIVLIDALNPWGYGHLLPRGLLREPLSALRRADLVVLTRADRCAAEKQTEIRNRIAEFQSPHNIVEVAFPPQCLVNSNGETAELHSLHGKRVSPFCGIGNPLAFFLSLADAGMVPGVGQSFADHHHYSQQELAGLGETAKHSSAEALVTTQKDLVKINRPDLGGCPLWAVQISTQVVSGNDRLEECLGQILRSVKR